MNLFANRSSEAIGRPKTTQTIQVYYKRNCHCVRENRIVYYSVPVFVTQRW